MLIRNASRIIAVHANRDAFKLKMLEILTSFVVFYLTITVI